MHFQMIFVFSFRIKRTGFSRESGLAYIDSTFLHAMDDVVKLGLRNMVIEYLSKSRCCRIKPCVLDLK